MKTKTKTTVAQLQMRGGMAYAVQLSDGRFIIVDGGEATDESCYLFNKNILYKYLRTRSDGAKIKVALWIITHFHSDHVDVAARFLEEYRDELEVEGFMYNKAPSVEYFSDSERDEELTREAAFERAMSFYPNSARISPRAGDRFVVADVVLDILSTANEPYPEKPTNANVISSVMKLTFEGGRSFMVLGDASCERLTSLVDPDSAVYCKEEMLKSDILQVAHHGLAVGYESDYPLITELYERIAPSVAFWSINEKRFLTDKWCRDPKHTYHKFLLDTVGDGNHSNSYTTIVDMSDLALSFEKTDDQL